MRNTVSNLFDELWDETLKRCIIPVTKRQQSYEEMQEFMIHRIVSFLDGFPYRERLKLQPEVKSTSIAQILRNAGNSKFDPNRKDLLGEALIFYNESIAHTEKGSPDRAIAYANRASVCLQFRRYADCLINIRLARESNYPAHLEDKLNRRETIAKKYLAEEHDGRAANATEQADRAIQNDRKKAVDELKLSYDAHANAPQAAECLRLQRNAQFGRHLVTDRALKVGDVLMIEKPFVSILFHDVPHVLCAYCHAEQAFILIPCEVCSTEMYCSEECLNKAQHYHRYECGALRNMWYIADHINGMAGLRAVTVAIAMFDHDLDALEKHLNELDESKVSAFTMNWKTATPKDIYNTVHVLPINDAFRHREKMARQIFHSTIVLRILLERTGLGAMCAGNPKKEKLIFKLILRHWQIGQSHWMMMRHSWHENASSSYGSLRYAVGYFPLLSLVKHSCVPNVQQITLPDGRTALIAINPIAAGEQLFQSHFFPMEYLSATMEYFSETMEYLERRTALEDCFNLICHCDGCELQFDTLQDNVDDDRFLWHIKSIQPASKRLELLVWYMNDPGRQYLPYFLTKLQAIYVVWLSDLYSHSTLLNFKKAYLTNSL
ncbi:SET and MYND domain-containing protein 4-like [Anopheles maculipalpis]|uniref:SET and MYND domain-containing protein 4-like n=1 Tax=Anopheles maculipalpis TaxID=1496333 RepID=UPI002158FCC6|nr:SET and MYND domain-containing protein 4-like [Anopheles maculipalpis]